MNRRISLTLLLCLTLLWQGCVLWLKPPTVTLVSLDVLEANFFEQRYALKLRVQNPNDRDIRLTGLSFEVELNDQPFAKGVSDKPVILKGLCETMVEVTAVSDLAGVLRQVDEYRQGNRKSVSYRIKGRLVTGFFISWDWDFVNSGAFDLPISSKDR